MDGHKEPGGNFHPHSDKPGIHSSSINTDSKVNTGFLQRGSNKKLQVDTSGDLYTHLVYQMKRNPGESPEHLFNRIEPIIAKLNNMKFPGKNDDDTIYLNSLLNDLEEPDAKPGEYDDGAKLDNYQHDLTMLVKAIN